MFTDAGGTHAEVIDSLTRSPQRKLKSIGYRLKQCRDLRVKADYRIEVDFTVQDAETARGVVSRILSWDHPGNWSDCSVDGLLGKTEQSGSRPEPSPLPFS